MKLRYENLVATLQILGQYAAITMALGIGSENDEHKE